jgi:hypothetical protein
MNRHRCEIPILYPFRRPRKLDKPLSEFGCDVPVVHPCQPEDHVPAGLALEPEGGLDFPLGLLCDSTRCPVVCEGMMVSSSEWR